MSRNWVFAIPGAVSIGFGHTAGRYVLLGARVGGNVSHTSASSTLAFVPQESSMTMVNGSLAPYVEVRPLPELPVQPFAVVEGGVELYGMRRRTLQGYVTEPHRVKQIRPSVGGRFGLHAFVLPRLSIDADLGLRRRWLFEWMASPARGPDDLEGPQPVRLDLAGTLGISGWW